MSETTQEQVPSMWFGWLVSLAAIAGAAWLTFGLEHPIGAGIAGLTAGFLIGVCIDKTQNPEGASVGRDVSNFLLCLLSLGVTIWGMFGADHAIWAGGMGLITGLFVIIVTKTLEDANHPRPSPGSDSI